MGKKAFGNGTVVLEDDLNALIGGHSVGLWVAETSYPQGELIKADSRVWRQVGENPNVSGSSEPTWSNVTEEGVTLADGSGFWQLFEGHHHDGHNFQGSCPVINLTEGIEVKGALPLANQVSHVHDGSERSKINPISHILGSSEGSFSLIFPDTQFTAEQTITVHWKKQDGSGSGKPAIIELNFPAFSATSNGTSFSSSNTIPTGLIPTADLYAFFNIINSGELLLGQLKISSAGLIAVQIFKTQSGDAGSFIQGIELFVNNGSKGFPCQQVRYPIWPT